MVTTISPPEAPLSTSLFSPVVKQGENRVALRGIIWLVYQQILNDLPQSRAARLTYDRGILEITMPLETHEYSSELIGLFIRIFSLEMGLKLKSMRSTTINRPDLEGGVRLTLSWERLSTYPKVYFQLLDNPFIIG